MGAIKESTDSSRDAGDTLTPTTAALIAELNSNTDLPSLIERVVRNSLPWVVIPAAALTAWEERDPAGWAKVSAWLAVNEVTIVRI